MMAGFILASDLILFASSTVHAMGVMPFFTKSDAKAASR
jgi:hypothetical protein